MSLRFKRIDSLQPYHHAPCDGVSVAITDIGRAVGSKTTGLVIQRIKPGFCSSQKHRHIFQEEILIVMDGAGILHHGDSPVNVNSGDCFCYLPGDQEAHMFENTGRQDLVIWAFGDRLPHEVCVYPDQGVAFVEGLGCDIPLDSLTESIWTEAKRPK